MQIIPIRDLKDTNKIYERAQASSEPIFVTKNGYGAMVLMSIEAYKRNYATTYVMTKLKESSDGLANGAPTYDAFEVLDELRAKYVR